MIKSRVISLQPHLIVQRRQDIMDIQVMEILTSVYAHVQTDQTVGNSKALYT